MSTQIQLRRGAIAEIGESAVAGITYAEGEPIAVYAGANTTPRLYIGDNATTINGGLIGLGGPNSVTVDQIRGLGSTSPNGANFGSSGTANRVILLDANGAASLSQLNTQSTSGNTTLTMTGDLTAGTIVLADQDKKGVKLDTATGIIQIQQVDGATAECLQVYEGSTKTLTIAADGDITGVKDATMTGKLGIGAQGATLKGTFIHVGATSIGRSPSSDADDIFVESTGNTGITIGSGASGTGNVVFDDTGGTDIGKIQYKHSDNSLNFHTGAVSTPRLAIGGGGDIIATGKVTAEGFDAGSNLINNVTNPSGAQDAATKSYVDAAVQWNLGSFGAIAYHDSTWKIAKLDPDLTDYSFSATGGYTQMTNNATITHNSKTWTRVPAGGFEDSHFKDNRQGYFYIRTA